MRTVTLAILAVSITGCVIVNDSSNSNDPTLPTLELGDARRMAAGTTVEVLVSATPGVTLASNNPTVVDIRRIDTTHYAYEAHAPGGATISAFYSGSEIDSVVVESVPVVRVDVFYGAAPGFDRPIASLAGIAGGFDHVCVRNIGAGEEILAGTGTFAASGAVELTGDPARRLSEAFAQRAACAGVQFGELGTGEVIARAGDRETRVPIEVIAAPATAELTAIVLRDDQLVTAPEFVDVAEYVGVDLIARTADGRFVGGLATTWAATGTAENVLSGPTELVIRPTAAGRVDVTATAGAITRMRTITAQ